SVTAAEFYARASHLMSQDEKNPTYVSKRSEADRRRRALNPYGYRLGAMMEEYAQSLETIFKKNPDTLTRNVALDRISSLQLASILPPEKMPKIGAAIPGPTPKAAPVIDRKVHLVHDFPTYNLTPSLDWVHWGNGDVPGKDRKADGL